MMGDQSSDGFGENRRFGQQADAPGTCRRAGRRSSPGGPARPPRVTRLGGPRFVAADGGHPHDGRPAGLAPAAACAPGPPPAPRASVARGWRRPAPRSRRGCRRRARTARAAPAARARRPTGRCRRPAPARRASRPRRGPPTTIQPSFRCGRPHDFDRPPRLKTRARRRQRRRDRGGRDTRRDPGRARTAANTSSAMIASSAARRDVGQAGDLVALRGTRPSGCSGSRRRWRAAARRAPRASRAPARCWRSRCARRRRTPAGSAIGTAPSRRAR